MRFASYAARLMFFMHAFRKIVISCLECRTMGSFQAQAFYSPF
jgi:hypothetical protein